MKTQQIFTQPFTKNQILTGMLYFFIGHNLITPVILLLVLGEDNGGLMSIINIAIITLFMVGLTFKKLKSDFSRFIKNAVSLLWLVPLLYVIQLLGRMVVTVLMQLIHGVVSLGDNQEAVESIFAEFPILMGIMIVVFAPIWEELFFTGFIYESLRKKNKILAYIVTSVAFGLLHTFFAMILNFSPILILATFIYVPLSMVCCYVYEKTDSIWSAIMMHAFSNGMALVFLLAASV